LYINTVRFLNKELNYTLFINFIFTYNKFYFEKKDIKLNILYLR